ncbi:MAG: RHS repeat-associated core domain-containing protein, partial [Alcaligenaceae bacterium]
GLHYNHFRSYDSKVGRYTQADPVGLEGGWNRFSYVGGNPLRAIDPLGLAEVILGAGVSPTDVRIPKINRQLESLERMLKRFSQKCPGEGKQLLDLFDVWRIYLAAGTSSNDGQDGYSNAETDGENKITKIFSNTNPSIRLWSHEIYHLMPSNVVTLKRNGTRETLKLIPWEERSWERPAIDFERRIRDLDCTCPK